jgi:hypothetical protein
MVVDHEVGLSVQPVPDPPHPYGGRPRNDDRAAPEGEPAARHHAGTLVRRHGQLDPCEDADKEASFAGAQQRPGHGVPDRSRSGC